MKNAMQLKAIIKNISKEKKISAQLVMQNFMLERLLDRISISKYYHNFVLKGGFLIAAMVGLDTRATMDMDATIKEWPVNEESIKKMFLDICSIDLCDNITFEFKRIDKIREGDEYTGYRVSLSANYPPMAVPLKLDITTGDKITPEAIKFRYKLLLEDKEISVLAYNLETIMAEKLESIVSRGDLLRKLNFPKQTIVISSVLGAAINFLINLVVVFAFALINQVPIGINTLVIIPLFMEVLLMAMGVAFILSALFVKYRDIGPIWEVVLQAGMYASPIIYSITYLLQRNQTFVAKVMMLNPIAQILQDMRHFIIDPVNPRGWDIINNKLIAFVPYAIPVVIFIIGFLVFNRNAKRFAEIL